MKEQKDSSPKATSRQGNIVILAKRDDPFARIPHTVLDDERLSMNAKGVLCYLLGKPTGWKVRAADIEKHCRDGSRAIRSALKELREVGYAQLVRLRDEKGKTSEWVWKISDCAIFSPDVRNAHVENADVENAHHSKNEGSKKEFSKNQTKETEETPCGARESFSSSPKENSPLADIPAQWKPHTIRRLGKEEQLRKLRVPRDYPSEEEFESFLLNNCGNICNYRGGLYSDLCDMKWHQWDGGRWIPVRDWKAYVLALEEKMDFR